MVGDDANPAVPGYDPDISAELYTTNGETDEHAPASYGTLGFTPEMSTCETASAVDPDDAVGPGRLRERLQLPRRRGADPGRVREEHPVRPRRRRSRPSDPDDPVSVVGRDTPGLRGRPVRRLLRRPPAGRGDRPSATSRNLRMHYRINGGRPAVGQVDGVEGRRAVRRRRRRLLRRVPRHGRAAPSPATGRGLVHRRQARAAGQSSSDHFTYTVASDIGGKVLILAAEDYTGVSPVAGRDRARSTPTSYAAALDRGRLLHGRVRRRRARPDGPHPLGVLSHYKAVRLGDRRQHHPASAPASVPGHGGRRRRWTSSWPSATTSTRAASCCYTGKYAGFAQAAERRATSTTRSPDQPECTTPTATRACRCSTTSCSTGSVPTPTSTTVAPTADGHPLPAERDRRRRSTGSPGRSTAATRRATRTTRRRSCRRRASCRRRSSRSSPARHRWTGYGRARLRSSPYTGDWYVYSERADSQLQAADPHGRPDRGDHRRS